METVGALFSGREPWTRGRFPEGEGPMIWFAAAAIAGAMATTGPAERPPSYHLPPAFGRTAEELLNAPDRHVRGLSPLANQMLAEGMKRSRTFEAIIEAIEGTD